MDSNRIVIGALLFILLIIGSNVALYFIARSWARGDDSRWLSALKDTLSKPTGNAANKSMDELREKVVALEK